MTDHLILRMAQGGVEPPTQGFSVLCYYQLSYRAVLKRALLF